MTGGPDLRPSAVEHAITRFLIFCRYERLRLYRLHLQVTVNRISPVALDLAAGAGFNIDQVLRLLPVPEGWPWPGAVPPARTAATTWISLGRKAVRRSLFGSGRQLAARLSRDGVLKRGRDAPGGELGFLVCDEELEVVARLDRCVLHTRRGMCRLLMPDALPETIRHATIGRPIGDLVDHPTLADRSYRILSVRNAGSAGGTVVTFATTTKPLQLPWSADLNDEMERYL